MYRSVQANEGAHMGRQRIEHTAVATADPATVYALLRDGASWPAWAPIDSLELERPGDEEPEGLGAVRLLRGGRVTGHDTHVSNLPVRDYRGDIDLEPVAGGTRIRWVSQFEPKYPGTGALLRRGLDGFIAKCVGGLAEHASVLAGGAGRAAA
jgi:hypothetical protein